MHACVAVELNHNTVTFSLANSGQESYHYKNDI